MPVTHISEALNLELRATFARRRRSQADVGALLRMSQAAVADRLSGKTPWRIDELLTLCELLAVRLPDLLVAAERAADEATARSA